MKISSALVLATVLGAAGTVHFVRPRVFDPLVPHQLPGSPRSWTYASGVAELACATAVALPATRRAGGALSAALFIAVFPGNVVMAGDYHRRGAPFTAQILAFARLPLQYPLVRWALRVHHSAAPRR